MVVHWLLTVGKPGVRWRLQGSGTMVQHSSEIPKGQTAISGCTAQEQPPRSQGRAAESVRRLESNGSPHLAHAGPPRSPSHRRWLGASWVKEWTLRTHRLWWKVSARSCSRRPESCKRKSLGGGGRPSSEPILDNLPAFVSWPEAPQFSPHGSITAGCSHKGAKTRPIELTHS